MNFPPSYLCAPFARPYHMVRDDLFQTSSCSRERAVSLCKTTGLLFVPLALSPRPPTVWLHAAGETVQQDVEAVQDIVAERRCGVSAAPLLANGLLEGVVGWGVHLAKLVCLRVESHKPSTMERYFGCLYREAQYLPPHRCATCFSRA
jgi:hypothetical protein